MADDPRTPTPGSHQPPPPDNSRSRPAPGGAGTGTKGDPAKEPAAQPKKQRVWNLLDDLDKVTGGGAEAFWQ